MDTENKKDVIVIFEKSPNYQVSPVNGVWGNWIGDNTIICDFFLDHGEMPSAIKATLLQEGGLKENDFVFEHGKKQPAIIREKMCALTMTRESARIIGQWLLNFSEGDYIKSSDGGEGDEE